jgi:hypothetical protein
LEHTFENGCAAPGDGVDDTPAQASETRGCPTTNPDTCPLAPGVDPIHNYMDYSDDICYTEFTQAQMQRMHAAWDEYRSPSNTVPTPSPSTTVSTVPTRSPSTAPTCGNFFIFILAVIVKILTLGFVKLCV